MQIKIAGILKIRQLAHIISRSDSSHFYTGDQFLIYLRIYGVSHQAPFHTQQGIFRVVCLNKYMGEFIGHLGVIRIVFTSGLVKFYRL